MCTTDALLIILIIIIIFYISKGTTKKPEQIQKYVPYPKSDDYQEQSILSNNNNRNMTYEEKANKAMKEQMEYFQVCKDPDEIKKLVECACEGQDTFDYAENAYGAPGMDYKSWVTSQSVGEDTIKNHQQYIADREKIEGSGGGAFFTGRTMSTDSHDSYDPIPWIGLRRPQYVEQCNPTQVPDVDLSLYKRNRYFCFRT